MRADYTLHEELYRRYQAAGRPGWETVDQMNRTIITLEKMMQNAYVPRKGRLLELGCGSGNITLWLAARGYNAFGVDISETAISWAREAGHRRKVNVDFRVGNVIEMLDYTDDYFDIILDGNLLHCIIGDDRQAALANVRRVLRSGGYFHIGTMCGKVHGKFFRDWYDPQTRCVLSTEGVALRYVASSDEILDEIKIAGFYILNWKLHPANRNGDDNDYLEVDVIKP